MTLIAQVSDVHFGSESAESAAALLDELNREPLDLVILSGDLTLAARNSEFEAARRFIDGLRAPSLSVPGNHDITPYKLLERFTRPYKRWHTHISDELEPSWSGEGVAIVGINTARRMRLRLDWSHGSISRRQIESLGARFDALPQSAFRIVVAHHPFIAEDTEDLSNRPRVMVKRADEALQEFARQRVDLVTAGHLHRTYTAEFESDPASSGVMVSGEAQSHKVTIIQAGTAISARTRGEANSFNRIEIEGERMEVHTIALEDAGWRRSAEPMVVIDKSEGTHTTPQPKPLPGAATTAP